jgi:hypothetical protein
MDVRTTLLPSWGTLLLYHVERRTEGADVPQHIMKVAKSSDLELVFFYHGMNVLETLGDWNEKMGIEIVRTGKMNIVEDIDGDI